MISCGTIKNRMIWVLILEVNALYDAVFLFGDKYTPDERMINELRYKVLRLYFDLKINRE